MNYGDCVHCNETVYESDERASTGIGVAHFECHSKYQEECQKEQQEFYEQEKIRWQRENKLVERLKRTLKPKLWAVVKMVFDDHTVNYIQIDTFDKVRGTKELARDWFGESVAVRHIYDWTSTCSYSCDTYGGIVWIPIGKGRYLHLHISG